jgi:hypothetical protein
MGSEWIPYENTMLISLAEFLGPNMKGGSIQEYFPDRSIVECEVQWERLKLWKDQRYSHTVISGPNIMENESSSIMSALPVVPFLNVCSFLNAKEVFKTLPLVCKHFNSIIGNYEIPIDSVEIKYYLESERELVLLERRLLKCKRVSITGFKTHAENSFWTFALRKLLVKLKPHIEKLDYWSEWHVDIAELVNGCPKLTDLHLSLNGFYQPWTWDESKINPGVSKIYFSDVKLFRGKAKNLLRVMPGLKSMELGNTWTPISEYDPEPIWENASQLTLFKGSYLLDKSQFSFLETLDIQVTSLSTFWDLIHLLPSLPKLRTLVLRLRWTLARLDGHLHFYGAINTNEMLQLRFALGRNPTMERLEILIVSPFGSCNVDPMMEQLLENLPPAIKCIKFREKILRE